MKEEEIKKLEQKISDPKTPQGDIKTLGYKLAELKRKKEIADRENFEEQTKTSVYGSDDYVGCSAGDYSFYYGYEETKCPIKSHRNEDDCYEKDCDKREWCFVVNKGDKEVVKWAESEFSYNQANNIEKILIIGMAKFIKEFLSNQPK